MFVHKAQDVATETGVRIQALCRCDGYQLAELWENVTCPECLALHPEAIQPSVEPPDLAKRAAAADLIMGYLTEAGPDEPWSSVAQQIVEDPFFDGLWDQATAVRRVADRWQWGGWSDISWPAGTGLSRLAIAQQVATWLRTQEKLA